MDKEQNQAEENTVKTKDNLKQKEKKHKKDKTRMFLVLAFLVLFAGISYIVLRGSYLEYLELGQKYVSVFSTNLKYRYTIMAVNFVVLYLMLYLTNRGIKKGLKPFFEKEKKTMPKLPNKSLSLVISAITSFVVSSMLTQKLMLIMSGASFGTQDPLFGLDIAYYVFIRILCILLYSFICRIINIYGIILCNSL